MNARTYSKVTGTHYIHPLTELGLGQKFMRVQPLCSRLCPVCRRLDHLSPVNECTLSKANVSLTGSCCHVCPGLTVKAYTAAHEQCFCTRSPHHLKRH